MRQRPFFSVRPDFTITEFSKRPGIGNQPTIVRETAFLTDLNRLAGCLLSPPEEEALTGTGGEAYG